jgi:Ca2+-binding RTX toxin-like protein
VAIITGTVNDDILNGTAGDDVITGGNGGDTMSGGAGADVFAYLSPTDSIGETSDARQDLITDFQTGLDVIDVTALSVTSVSIARGDGFSVVSVATTAQGLLRINVQGVVTRTDLRLSGTPPIVELIGTNGYDHLVGTPGSDVLIGGGAGDNLTGDGNGNIFKYFHASDSSPADYDIITDFKTGGDFIDISALQPGNVSLVHSNGATYLFATNLQAPGEQGATLQIAVAGSVAGQDVVTVPGLDAVYGTDTKFYIVGDNVSSLLVGGHGDSVIVGGSADDSLEGRGGDDVLIGGGGSDRFSGGAGKDAITYHAISDSVVGSPDVIQYFVTGEDSLDLTYLGFATVKLTYAGRFILITDDTGQTNFQIVSESIINGSDIRGVSSVHIVGDSFSRGLIGGDTSDVIEGGFDQDGIQGGGGGDALWGRGGTDWFTYTKATDSNANGMDIIHDFNTGVDRLNLSLNPTNVSIVHYNGGVIVFGVSDGATFQIGSTQDINAPDILGLTSGAYILGENGGETLIGGAFGESIVGGTGADIIIGGEAADALYGGAGADTFKYKTTSDSLVSAADIIHDFQSGVDKIDLTGVHHAASDAYGLAYAGGATFLFVDLGGNGVNEMLIQVATATLQAGDILW